MSDDSDIRNKSDKRCKSQLNPTSSSECSDNDSPLVTSKRSRKQLVLTDGSSSSENEEIIVHPSSRRGALKILSDYETGDSNDEDGGLVSDSTGSSDNEDDPNEQLATDKTKLDDLVRESSSDWDGQSEKCPICLTKFSSQEIGTPETCDHYFCAVCIQEWAKNVNTCPVDRQPFTLILVRQHFEGKVTRQIPVNVPTLNQDTPVDDATFCEVCGLSDREDRMLLCDSCDHGYHMECLNPSLDHVPINLWYCPECAPLHRAMQFLPATTDFHHMNEPDRLEEIDFNSLEYHYRPAPRMLPRTRQSERVQRTLHRTRQQAGQLQPSTSSGIESMEGDGNSIQRRSTTRRNRRKKRQSKFRIKRIVTDDGTIEVLVKRKRRKKYQKKRKNRTLRSNPRSVKGRLANKLGMCAPHTSSQMIPESVNRQEITNAPINHQRHQAGIPTLDIFGRRDQLDYFSGSDYEEDTESLGGGLGVLFRGRVARPSDRLISRKKAMSVLSTKSLKKPLKVEEIPSPASGSLLDSILSSQTLWHSKKAEIKSKSDGSLQVILPKNSKHDVLKEDNKIDVRRTVAPVTETPMFPGGRVNSGTYKSDTSSRGGSNQNESRSNAERTYESNYQPTASGEGGFVRYDSSVGPAPLRGVTPIRFRMNIPPRRPNIHSYPTDNIPPPPPLRLRSPLVEMTFQTTNSPEASPSREEEEIDIYSDIEHENNASETEDKTFGTLEPPPEPPFLMTMEPPPEPPAILMHLNDDASDDEPSGLVIDDPPVGDVYDPCAANSDDSSTGGAPLTKPPAVPKALKERELVANYSSDSCPTTETPFYNPELPTYMSTPIIGPLPKPTSQNSSEAEDNDEECPNFSMYSAESMNLAHRGISSSITTLDIPIPPTDESKILQNNTDIPLPDGGSTNSSDKEGHLNIPVPPEEKLSNLIPDNNKMPDDDDDDTDHCEDTRDSEKDIMDDTEVNNEIGNEAEDHEKKSDGHSISEEDNEEEDNNDEEGDGDNDQDDNESEGNNSILGDAENVIKCKTIKVKPSSEAGEDECSTQGDVLDLAIESEANLENNMHHEDSEEQHDISLLKSPVELYESVGKIADGGDKSDGLVDITDEEMSVYDGQDTGDDLEKLDEQILESVQSDKICSKSLYSDDDNSLVGGATSAVSAGTLNNSDNIHPPTLPGLEGLETETISESEDVNFDELPLESNEQPEVLLNEDDRSSSKKKKKKKYRKISHTEEGGTAKGNNEPLEFEEGEIIEDKPKQVPKKDKKIKPKPDSAVEVDENVDSSKSKTPAVEKDSGEKKIKKKKEKVAPVIKEKNDKSREIKEKTLKAGQIDENISWKKLSKSSKERNYRDGKEEKDRVRDNKDELWSKKEKKSKEKRRELERYDVRRLISEKPKRPKKDEFGRDISPSKSGSSLSPYRPNRYRSPLRTRNRSRTRSKSFKSRSRSRGRRRRSRSRNKARSRERVRRTRSRDRSRRRSRSRNQVYSRSRDRRREPDKINKDKTDKQNVNKTYRKPQSSPSRRNRSLSYSRSWTPSWSKSSMSRSRTPQSRRRSKSFSRSKSRSWTREQNLSLRAKDPPKNLTVIVTNKDALKKKEKRKSTKKKDDRRKKKRGQSPAPSKEVFTSGDNILVSVNFKNANKNPEIIPATTPLLRESSKRKRDDTEGSTKKKKANSSSKKTPAVKKSNRLAKINEVTRNAKPVAIIDLDLSPFREQTPSPKEVIILSDSGDEGDKQRLDIQNEMDRMDHSVMNQNMLSLSSIDHGQNSMLQPESPLLSTFMLNSSGPKTPPEPHIKFSITTKPSQIRMLSNPLMEAEEEMQDEHIENDINEILHKGPNTPPEPPPDLNTPASPPTTPYDPFDPTKSRSPSPQPRSNDIGLQLNTSREDKLDNMQNDDDGRPRITELRSSTPPNEPEDVGKTPEPVKGHSTPKTDPNTDISPKVSPPTGISEQSKPLEDTLMKPIQKLLASAATKLDVAVHKSPEKLITVVISQQVKNSNQTPKQAIQPLKAITPNKHQTPKGNVKHQLFSSSLVKQVPILSTLPLLSGAPIYTPSMSLNSSNKTGGRIQQNGDPSDDMDIDPSSPYSPGSSEGDDLFEPPLVSPPRSSTKPLTSKSKPSSSSKFDSLFGSSPAKLKHSRLASKALKKGLKLKSKGNKKEEVKVKLDEDQLKILDDLPSSAVEMQVKDKFLKKLNRQERVVEEVKLVLKPHYAKKHVNKEEYKEILRRSVPKICHNKSGEINPIKIQFLVEAYVKKFRYAKKKTSGALPASAQNKPKPQKTLWS